MLYNRFTHYTSFQKRSSLFSTHPLTSLARSETTDDSIAANRAFVADVLAFRSALVQPIVTPRFAVSCDAELMRALGALAAEHRLRIQTHISESRGEIAAVAAAHPGQTYAQVYDAAGLLTERTVLAHGVHLGDAEVALLAERGAAVAHCPGSNTNLRSGLCDVRRLLRGGVTVGLGTDVSGGCRASVLAALKDALDVSAHVAFGQPEEAAYEPLSYKEGVYLATLGGARALGVDGVVGNFAVGKEFDALLVEVAAGGIDWVVGSRLEEAKGPEQRLLELVQRFVYVGDDRNVQRVFVQGRVVKG